MTEAPAEERHAHNFNLFHTAPARSWAGPGPCPCPPPGTAALAAAPQFQRTEGPPGRAMELRGDHRLQRLTGLRAVPGALPVPGKSRWPPPQPANEGTHRCPDRYRGLLAPPRRSEAVPRPAEAEGKRQQPENGEGPRRSPPAADGAERARATASGCCRPGCCPPPA